MFFVPRGGVGKGSMKGGRGEQDGTIFELAIDEGLAEGSEIIVRQIWYGEIVGSHIVGS